VFGGGGWGGAPGWGEGVCFWRGGGGGGGDFFLLKAAALCRRPGFFLNLANIEGFQMAGALAETTATLA
jgi:hypothetical protein